MNTNSWDELLHAIGRGWPHYKDIALPLISKQEVEPAGESDNLKFIAAAILLLYSRKRPGRVLRRLW